MAKTELAPRWSGLAAQQPSDYLRYVGDLWSGWDPPETYDWLYQSAEAVDRTSPNRDVWLAHYSLATWNDVEAYTFLQTRKVVDLCESLVASLNSDGHLAAAAAARHALEAAISLLSLVHRAEQAFKAPVSRWPESIPDLNAAIVKAIWGGKAQLTEHEATNLLTHKNRVLKAAQDDDTKENLDATYSVLCDVVHPSVVGNWLYWGNGVESPTGDQWALTLGPSGPVRRELAITILWAMGWSLYWTRHVAKVVEQHVAKYRRLVDQMRDATSP